MSRLKERHARIFRNGRSRAVRIPSEFVLEGDEVVIRQDEDGVITIRPVADMNLLSFIATLDPLDEADRLPDINDGDLTPLGDVDL